MRDEGEAGIGGTREDDEEEKEEEEEGEGDEDGGGEGGGRMKIRTMRRMTRKGRGVRRQTLALAQTTSS